MSVQQDVTVLREAELEGGRYRLPIDSEVKESYKHLARWVSRKSNVWKAKYWLLISWYPSRAIRYDSNRP